MDNIKNCMKCGKMFKSVSGIKVCLECIDDDNDLFKIVRDYLYDHPGATINMVSSVTKISEEKILEFIRQGRIETNG